MIDKLLKIANMLDDNGLYKLAEELDCVIKKAITLTPEKEKELDESVDRYFADPNILEEQKRDELNEKYNLDPYLGFENIPWHGYKQNHSGLPSGKENLFKKHMEYITIIVPVNEEVPPTILEPHAQGIWEFKGDFDAPEEGKKQVVYELIPQQELERRKERKLSPESKDILEETETMEAPEDVVETTEQGVTKPGGGIHLF